MKKKTARSLAACMLPLAGIDDPEKLSVTYVVNEGGFVNQSFQVQIDGAADGFHVKLADADHVGLLKQWHRLADILSERYHAPPVLAWVEPPESGLAGLVFPLIEGRTPTVWEPTIADGIAATLRQLHDDDEVRSHLVPLALNTCRAFYESTYGERYRDDLEIIVADTPEFVTPDDLSHLQRYATELYTLVRASSLFDGPADQPTHTDIWLNNVLIADDERWYLLDWDDLQLGDPVLDFAMVGGPTIDNLERRIVPASDGELSNAEIARVVLYHRMMLLDWAIDTLADWIDSAKTLTDPTDYRVQKRHVHARALALYRKLYD